LQAGVYPNPSQGKTTLKAQLAIAQPYNISVIAQDGRIVWNQSGVAQTDRNYFNLDLTHLSKGIYTLQVQSKDKQYSEKLILTP
jgi:hypothetical protein